MRHVAFGLDLSITATGVARKGNCHTFKPKMKGDWRLVEIVEHVDSCLLSDQVVDVRTFVVIEDLPTHAHSAGITGMVHGAIRNLLLTTLYPYALVPPATLKFFATGKGNCSKGDMAVAAYKRAGMEFVDDNACDAWWLMMAGYSHFVGLGYDVDLMPPKLPLAQIRALDKIAWPKLPPPP